LKLVSKFDVGTVGTAGTATRLAFFSPNSFNRHKKKLIGT
jgi:hypothetical protein